MRTRLFRILSGVVAVLFIWFLVALDHANRSARELFGFCGIAVMFAIFALFGTDAVGRFQSMLFGIPGPNEPPKGRG